MPCHWFSRFLLGNINPTLQPKSKAMQARHLIKYVVPMLKTPGWARAVHHFFAAYEENPEGECNLPPQPINHNWYA
jgi:hypothetical protein